jgi:AraC-like DNA-binding protein
MREIIRAGAWGGFAELVEELGGDADGIYATVGVEAALLTEADRYMPLRAYIECQELAATRLNKPDFGLRFGLRQNIAMLGPLSIAIMNSSTARQGIEVCARYLHVHNPAGIMSLTPMPRSTRDFLEMSTDIRRPARREQNTERAMSSVHKSMGQIGGDAYTAREVWFMHQPLSPLLTYREVFGVVPQFGKPMNGIAIDRSVLDAWQPGRSPQLRKLAESFLRSLTPARSDSFTLRCRNMVRGLLRGGECTPESTAQSLGLHERTLQRRLKSEGTSFEKIKDEVRRELAETLLAQPDVSLSQIALMLDYADASAFSRSCRRWFGEPPRTVRRQMLMNAITRKGPDRERLNPLVVAHRMRQSNRV